MTDADIKPVARKVDEVDGQVRKVGRDVRNVQSQMVEVGLRLESVDTAVAGVHGAIETLDQHQRSTLNKVTTLQHEVLQYLERNELAQTKQFAQTELIEVRQTLENKYGHFAVVRRSAVGILQAMDARLVSDSAVRELTEELMITAPGYWLAPALVALGAWLRDERPLGQRAVLEALRRDRDKSALFFILVLQRHRREDAVALWVEHYVAHQDPLALAPEFRIVLDATTTGLFGEVPRARVADIAARWAEELGARPQLAEKQVQRWVTRFEDMHAEPPDLPSLARSAPGWERLADLSRRAGVFEGGLRFLDAVFAAGPGPDQSLEVRVDAVLDRLTADFDQEEAPLRRKAERLAAIVEHDGDVAAAEAAGARAASVDDTVDFLRLISDAALGGDDAISVPAPTRRLAVALSRSWAASAVDRIEEGLLRGRPQGVLLRHGAWEGVLNDATTPEALQKGVAAHYERRTVDAVDAVALLPRAWGAGVAGALVVALGVLALVYGHLVVGVVALVLAAASLVFLVREVRAIPGRREKARQDGDSLKAAAENDVVAAVADAQVWLEDFDAALAQATLLRERLATVEP